MVVFCFFGLNLTFSLKSGIFFGWLRPSVEPINSQHEETSMSFRTIFAALFVLVTFSVNSARAEGWRDNAENVALAKSDYGPIYQCLEELRIVVNNVDASDLEIRQAVVKAGPCQEQAKAAQAAITNIAVNSGEQCTETWNAWQRAGDGLFAAQRECRGKYSRGSSEEINKRQECEERAVYTIQDQQRQKQEELLPIKTQCDRTRMGRVVTGEIVEEFPPLIRKALARISDNWIVGFRSRYLFFLPKKLVLPTGVELEKKARDYYPSYFSASTVTADDLSKMVGDSEWIIGHIEEVLLGSCRELRRVGDGDSYAAEAARDNYENILLHLLAIRWIREVKLGLAEPPHEYPFLYEGLTGANCSVR